MDTDLAGLMRYHPLIKTKDDLNPIKKGDLKKKIKEAKRLNRNFEEKQILDWIRQATNALNYLHSRKPDAIIHRDIKPE